MTTPLSKPVYRECAIPQRGRMVIAGLEPGDLVSVRFKGTRTTYYVPLANVLGYAQKVAASELRAQRAAKRKKGKK